MDFSEPIAWAAIRQEAEEFVAEHVTQQVLDDERRTGDGFHRGLMRELGSRGWIAPRWSVEDGGAGLDAFEAGVLTSTLRRGGVPMLGHGTTLLPANAIRQVGSEDLAKRVLPRVAAGELLICLGYTEPGGGSDLFACTTTAEPQGGSWRVNGQKMFTTFAHAADYCFLLTRSVPGSKGPRGLSVLLVPLDSPGIEIRPVRTMGHERTNVVFYSDVRVDASLVVGQPHEGLAVLRAALEAEHNVAPTSKTGQVLAACLAHARSTQLPDGRRLIDDPTIRQRLARMSLDAEVADLLNLRVAFMTDTGEKPGPVAALWGPESYVRASAAAIDICGPEGMLDWTDPGAPVDGELDSHYRAAVATTIYGGSSEVLRSLIVEQRLGFPRSRPAS